MHHTFAAPQYRRTSCADSNSGFSNAKDIQPLYLHRRPDWLALTWDERALAGQTGRARRLQGLLLGRVQSLGFDIREQATLETLTSDTASESRCFPP